MNKPYGIEAGLYALNYFYAVYDQNDRKRFNCVNNVLHECF